ncbi:meiotic recombination protein REC8 homolog [Cololabis saira]|uniref:meiotic recombination protein REC8 homolog n=1 Tax=Cololabis saira TaxID=129043 RepID=UPI002AD2D8C8|nr:meiotic recombination protein REC8 homolog [Cololabis saira]
MFYYPTVLKRHSGCFFILWLVGTKGIKVPRRDFLKVNVSNTCDQLMEYLLGRVPSPCPALPRPCFFLYLSTQLQYGLVTVYHRQCVIFLEELQFFLGKLSKDVLLPDPLSLLKEADGVLDPLFGVLHFPDAMPSPTEFIKMSQEFLRKASPELHELARSTSSEAAELKTGTTASPESITLRETEPLSVPAAEFEGEELIDQHGEMIDFLMAQADPFPAEALEPPRGEQGIELFKEAGDQEESGSSIELQLTMVSSEDSTLLPQEEPTCPNDQNSQRPACPPLTAPHSEGTSKKSEWLRDIWPEVRVKKPKRRRQLIFFDPETQRSPEEQRILDPLLPREIELLWRKAATIVQISGSNLQVGERDPESMDSERDGEAAETEEHTLELSSKEIERGTGEQKGFETSAPSTLPLDLSDPTELSQETPCVSLPGSGESVSPPPDMGGVEAELPPSLLDRVSAGRFHAEQEEPYGEIWIFPGPNYGELFPNL